MWSSPIDRGWIRDSLLQYKQKFNVITMYVQYIHLHCVVSIYKVTHVFNSIYYRTNHSHQRCWVASFICVCAHVSSVFSEYVGYASHNKWRPSWWWCKRKTIEGIYTHIENMLLHLKQLGKMEINNWFNIEDQQL